MSHADGASSGLQLFQRGRELRAAGDLAGAADALSRAASLLPDHPPLLAEYGALAEQVGNFAAAEKIWRRLGQLRPDSNFEGRLGVSLFAQQRYDEALPWLRVHCDRHPQDDRMQLVLAQALLKLLRWEEALALARGLLAHERNAVHLELVLNCLYNLGYREEVDALVPGALADFPEDPLILALCGFHLLKSGDFRRGFAWQPAIRRRYFAHKPDMRLPAAGGWDGRRFDGLLLLDGEQGLGEEILCASMFDTLQAIGQRTVVSCDPRLIPLFSRSFPRIEFVSRYSDEPAALEAQASRCIRFYVLDLACLFRRDPFRHTRPWLVADREQVASFREQYDGRYPDQRHFGISWRTVREVAGAPRSVRLTELAPLFRLPGVAWFNVQYGDYRDDIQTLLDAGLTPPWDDLRVDQTKDIDGLASQLCAFDGLVSISNTTVHLAGALGVPSHLLLPRYRPVMWYWGYTGDTTPWYPSIRIHRNMREDNWDALALQLADALAAQGGDMPRGAKHP